MEAIQDDLIDLKHFEVQDKMEKVKVWKFYQIMNINNGEKNLAKISYKNTKKFNKSRLIFFLQEVKIMSRINHPSILKFYGYNLTNFKNKPKPIMIMEFASKYNLSHFLSKTNDEGSDFLSKFNNTKKLINIYGISSAMSFLHSHNIIIRTFKLKQIFLDNNLYPKLSGFSKSFELSQNNCGKMLTNFSTIRGAKRYASPEVLSGLEYSKASDVYAFGILMCEIMNGEISYKNFFQDVFIKKVLNEGQRPQIDELVTDCYRNLIQKCWEKNPEDRPTFEYIVNELKCNQQFITEEVDADEFHKYVQFLDESETSFSEPKPHPKLEEFIENNIHKFNKSKINLEYRGPSFTGDYLDLTKCKLDDLLYEKDGYNIYAAYIQNEQPLNFEEKIKKAFLENEEEEEEMMNSIYSKFFCLQVYLKEINDFCQHDIINFSRKLSILSRINHPAILNFIGYSPVDFDNKRKPVIFTELSTDNNDAFRSYSEYTKRLINIYGIASAMSYLHSHGIIHRDLKPSNIIFDGNDLPKLTGFDISKEIDDNLNEESKIKGTPAYLAPEIYTNQEYSKASDVYSFGLLLYTIMTGKTPFEKILRPNELKHAICDERKRPEFSVPIAKAYRNLIERCWSHDPKLRPTFDEILIELKTNPEFITEEVDSLDFFEYAKFIDEFPTTFNESKQIKDFDESISSRIHTFTTIKSYPGLKDMYETEMNDLFINYDFFSLRDFVKRDGPFDIWQVASGTFYRVDDFDASLTESYAIKDINHELEDCSKSEIKNFIREMKIIPRLNHPSIVKYIGYKPSSTNFWFSSIMMEYMRYKSIYKLNKNDFDDTKKLIYFYGIAAGMAYLHSNNIIHRDLKPNNVFLDYDFYPKISGFNISKEVNDNGFSISKQLKGTPAYLAPEIYLRGEYSKSSDVYSFGLLMYEVLSGKRPFNNAMSPKEIKLTICKEGINLPISESISQPYRNLIERCLSQNSRARPTFETIVKELRSNPIFITQNVNENEYRKYIQYIDESPISYDSTKQVTYTENSLRKKTVKYVENNLKINIYNIYETELDNILLDYNFVDIHNYQKQKLIFANDDYKIQLISEKQTGKLCQIKKLKVFNLKNARDKYFSKKIFCDEINIYFEINHPSFLRLVGYCPFDFKDRFCPVIITEYGINGKLESVLELDSKNPNEMILNPTKRLIILYGIASGMSYLHSHNIIHGSLKPSNIYLDDFLFPRISGSNKSQILSENPIPSPENLNFVSFNYKDIYDSPEQCIFNINCSASDVYSFSFIAYQLILNELPFEKLNYNLIKQIFMNGLRPEFKENVPKCYKNMIEKCWSLDPNDRPTFDEIVYHLKTNPEFITDSINKEEFEYYVNILDEFQTNNNHIQLEDFFKLKTQSFRKVKLDFKKIRNSNRLNFTVNMGSIDLDNFEKLNKIGSGSFGNVYKVLDKRTQNTFAAKISIYEIDQCSNDTIINLSREIDIISKLNHPAILQFIGFNPQNFKNKPKPIIITEFASNCSLDKIIENERLGLGNNEWNDTKKLISIYGIASGMAYLHHLNILHRDLKPGNILLDDYLYPKIADFGLSKIFTKDDEIESKLKHPITSGFKGTYAYCSPEIIGQHKYTKAGDVYAYGMIVYEIMTNEIIFKDFNQFKLMQEVLNGYRPKFNFPIPYCYRKLIERCWGNSPNKRPDFSKIVELLEEDPNFITPNVDKDEYLDYISLIKESFPSCTLCQSNKSNDSFNATTSTSLSQSTKLSKKVSINLKIIESEIETSESDDKKGPFLDLTKFERQEIICKNDSSKIYKFNEIETGKFYAGQMTMFKISKLSKSEVDKLKNELEYIAKLNHPCLLKFVGYSPIDFKKQLKPVIVTDYFTNSSLSNLLELDRNKQQIQGWDSTKKLINLYGIASGMSYLHSHGIVHKSLKPCNIYLDDILTPKLGDFGLLTRFESSESITVQSISGNKATPIYSSPEVLLNNEYSKSSDVYSFAFIAYEIICNEVPFSQITNHNQIFHEIVYNEKRPNINENIPISYRKLIEQCWSQSPSERPTFDDIVYYLKIDNGFITDSINSDDYHKYIQFVEEQIESYANQKVDENGLITEMKTNNKTETNKNIEEIRDKDEAETNIKDEINDFNNESNFVVENESEENNQYKKGDKIQLKKKNQEEKHEISIESLEKLAVKYIRENDSENIFKILNILIQKGSTRIAIEYAVSLYKQKYYKHFLVSFIKTILLNFFYLFFELLNFNFNLFIFLFH